MDIKGIGLDQFANVVNDQSIKDDDQIVSTEGGLVSGGAEHKISSTEDKGSTEARCQLYRAVSNALGDTGFKDDLMRSIGAKLGLNQDGTGLSDKATTPFSKRVIREVVNLTKAIGGDANLMGESALPESVGKPNPAPTERTAAAQATEAVAEPKAGTLSAEHLKDLNDMASLAFGNGAFEGKSGGAGYMALVDGKAVKFMTRSSERSDFKNGKVPLYGSDKAYIAKATDDLKTKLLAIAATLDETRQTRIKNLLVEEKLSVGKETYGFLSRESVAAALDVFAEAGVGFDWSGVKPVKSEGDMSLEEKVLKHDAAHIEHWGEFDELLIGKGGKVNDAGFVTGRLKAFIGGTFGADALTRCADKLDQIAQGVTKSLNTPFPVDRLEFQKVRDAVEDFEAPFKELYKVLDECKNGLPEGRKKDVETKIEAFKDRQNEYECGMMEDSEVAYLTENNCHANARVIAKLRDANYVAHAGEGKDMGLVSCDDLTSVDGAPEDVWSSPEFVRVASNKTLDVTKYYLNADPGAVVCTEIFGDGSDLGCGIGIPWSSQEESVLKNTDPETMAYLLKTGQVKKIMYMPPEGSSTSPHVRYRYTDGANRLSTVGGFLIDGKIQGGKTTMLFSSMPGLGRCFSGRDPRGNTDWMCNCLKLQGKTVSPEMRVQVRKFIDKLYEILDANAKMLNLGPDDFADVMKTLFFGDMDGVCNVFCDEKDLEAEVRKFIDFAEKGKHKEPVRGGKSALEAAEANYDKTVRLTIRSWILKAKAQGTKYFVGGGIGCGVFANKPSFVAKILAEEFAAYGGNMKFVYMFYEGSGKETKAANKAQLAAFEDAFQVAGAQKKLNVAKPDMIDLRPSKK